MEVEKELCDSVNSISKRSEGIWLGQPRKNWGRGRIRWKRAISTKLLGVGLLQATRESV